MRTKKQLLLSTFVGISVILFSCGGKKDKPIIQSQDTVRDTNQTKSETNIIDTKSVFASYVGEFDAVEYEEKKKPSYSNKINITLDSIVGQIIYGHSIAAGNLVSFVGDVVIDGNNYHVTNAKEQGKNKYNGVFNFDLDNSKQKLKGTWVSNDKKMAVTKTEYDLARMEFKYNPKVTTESLTGSRFNGSEFDDGYEGYGEHSSGEGVTADASKFNPSLVLLKDKDISNMYKGDLEVMRNSIYARHGYSFQNRRMRYLFDDLDWYMPVSINITADLTDIEKKNIALLKRYEDHAEKYYDSWGR